jgi:hypothetical protein
MAQLHHYKNKILHVHASLPWVPVGHFQFGALWSPACLFLLLTELTTKLHFGWWEVICCLETMILFIGKEKRKTIFLVA